VFVCVTNESVRFSCTRIWCVSCLLVFRVSSASVDYILTFVLAAVLAAKYVLYDQDKDVVQPFQNVPSEATLKLMSQSEVTVAPTADDSSQQLSEPAVEKVSMAVELNSEDTVVNESVDGSFQTKEEPVGG
jgi:hypothetical protein